MQPEDLDVGFSASLSAMIFALLSFVIAPLIGAMLKDLRIPSSSASHRLCPDAFAGVHFGDVDRGTPSCARFRDGGKNPDCGPLPWQRHRHRRRLAGSWSLEPRASILRYLGILRRCNARIGEKMARLRFSWARLSPMLAFCGPIIGSQLLSQGTSRLVLLGMGHWHGVTAAGYWSVAIRISESVFGGLLQAAYNVGLAHFSLQHNARDKLLSTMREAQSFIAIAAVPLLAALAAGSEPLVRLLLSESWLPVSQLIFGPLIASFLYIRRMFPTTALRVLGHSAGPSCRAGWCQTRPSAPRPRPRTAIPGATSPGSPSRNRLPDRVRLPEHRGPWPKPSPCKDAEQPHFVRLLSSPTPLDRDSSSGPRNMVQPRRRCVARIDFD